MNDTEKKDPGGGRRSVRQLLALLAGALIVVFAVLNGPATEPVPIDLILIETELSVSLLVLVPLLVGLVLGWLEGGRRMRRKASLRGREAAAVYEDSGEADAVYESEPDDANGEEAAERGGTKADEL